MEMNSTKRQAPGELALQDCSGPAGGLAEGDLCQHCVGNMLAHCPLLEADES